MDMKRFFLYAIVIAALALAGCGGNGGGGDMTGPVDPPDPPPMCPEGQERNADGDCVTPPPPGPTAEELTARADTKRKAIAAEAGQTTDAGLGGSNADGTAVDTYSLTISRDRDGTEVKIADTALAGDDDPKFMQAMDLGGGTTMHVRTMDEDNDGNVVEEVVMVTTDIEGPRGRPFAMWQAMDGSTPQTLNARDLDAGADANGDGDNANDFTALTVDGTSADVRALVKSDAFVPGAGSGDTTLTFAFDAAGTTSMDEADEVMGTYNGAMGTYRCNGTADCTVVLNEEGMITSMTGTWVFTPAMGATSDQPDYDYLSYGFWLKRTTDEDGVLTYNEVEAFAQSSVAASADVSGVTGSATYSGGATGVYVHSVVNPDGTEASATSGHFMADAELTATFSQTVDDPATTVDEAGQIAPNMLNTLTGTINNFRLSGHDQGPGWSVALQGDITTSDGTSTGTAKGGGTDGTYSATFHGSVAAVDGVVPKPSSVVGEFNANFSNGSVLGGFGANRN